MRRSVMLRIKESNKDYSDAILDCFFSLLENVVLMMWSSEIGFCDRMNQSRMTLPKLIQANQRNQFSSFARRCAHLE
jgi:hypothetical protein